MGGGAGKFNSCPRLDDDVLAQALRHFGAEYARHEVTVATGRIGHDDPQRARGKFRRVTNRRRESDNDAYLENSAHAPVTSDR